MGSFVKIKKMGFYYNQQPQGFYYNQQPQKGFYYDQQDADEENNAGAWKKDANATAASERAKKIATAKVAGIMIANNHRPGASENRVLTQIAAERLAYEAGEVFMNTVAPNDDLTAEQIQEQLFKLAVKAIDGTKN